MRQQGASRNKTSLNRACFARTLFVYNKHVKVGVKWAAWGLFQFFWRPTKICETSCEYD